jgi:Haemolysin-III related
MVAFSIFGLSLIALYTASALYHLLPLSPPGVARLRRVDHMMIFVLIGGTFTPFCLFALDGGWRVGMLALVWSLALCGVLLKYLWMEPPRWLSVALYLGWLDRRGRRPFPPADDLEQGSSLGLGRGSGLQRGGDHLRAEAPEPDARGFRISRRVASVRHGGERLSFLGGAALCRAAHPSRQLNELTCPRPIISVGTLGYAGRCQVVPVVRFQAMMSACVRGGC